MDTQRPSPSTEPPSFIRPNVIRGHLNFVLSVCVPVCLSVCLFVCRPKTLTLAIAFEPKI